MKVIDLAHVFEKQASPALYVSSIIFSNTKPAGNFAITLDNAGERYYYFKKKQVFSNASLER